MATERPFDEIFKELSSHPQFVAGNALTREHVQELGIDPDALPSGFGEDCYSPLSQLMFELIDEALNPADEDDGFDV